MSEANSLGGINKSNKIKNLEPSYYSIGLKILQTSVPFLLSNAIHTGAIYIKMLIISVYAYEYLAAFSVGLMLKNVISHVGSELFTPLLAIVSKYNGKNEHSQIGIILRQSWVLAFVVAIITNVCIFIAVSLLPSLGYSSFIVNHATKYLYATCFTELSNRLSDVNAKFLLATDNENIVSISELIAKILGVTISLVSICGLIASPIVGLALGALAQSGCRLLLLNIYMLYNKACAKYQVYQFNLGATFDELYKLIRLGLPLAILKCCDIPISILTNALINSISPTSINLHQIAKQNAKLLAILPEAISQSIYVKVAKYFGKKKYAKMHKYANAGYLILGIACLLMMLPIVIFYQQIFALFAPLATNPLASFTIFAIFSLEAINLFLDKFITTSVRNLTAIGNSAYPVIVNILAAVIILPLNYLLCQTMQPDLTGLYILNVIEMFIVNIICFSNWNTNANDHNKLDTLYNDNAKSSNINKIGLFSKYNEKTVDNNSTNLDKTTAMQIQL